jgi:broad-specificity NMP kinase
MSANQTFTIYLSGKPGIGKYAIAKALSKHGLGHSEYVIIS